MKKIFIIMAAMAAFASVQAQSTYDFSAVSSSGDTLYYIIDDGNAVVTCPGNIDEDEYWVDGITQPQGALVIDATVTYNDTTYTVIAIGDYAFYGCSGITSVTIPNTVSSIDGYAFYGCSGMASVDIPTNVADFGSYVFSGCTALTEPIYQNAVFVFMPVSATGAYTIPNEITRICGGAFYECAGLTSVVLPNSVTEIGAGAFLDCNGLTQPIYNNTLFARLPVSYSGSYTIPDGITTVCASSFTYSTGLTELIMPNSVTTMGNGAIGYCTSLVSVTLSEALTSLPNFTFMGCTALPTLTLPASISNIGYFAFRNCTVLDSLVMKSTTPPSVSSMSFRGMPDSCLLTVPCGTLEAYTEAMGNYFYQIVEDCQTSIDDIAASDIKVYARNGRIMVEGAEGQQVQVFDLMGRQLLNINSQNSKFEIQSSQFPSGIYLVKVGNYPARKVAVLQ